MSKTLSYVFVLLYSLLTNFSFHASQTYLIDSSECKNCLKYAATADMKKNGLIAFKADGTKLCFASGFFPTMTQYIDNKTNGASGSAQAVAFYEMVDLLMPSDSLKIKYLNWILPKLDDMMSKVSLKQFDQAKCQCDRICNLLKDVTEESLIELKDAIDKFLIELKEAAEKKPGDEYEKGAERKKEDLNKGNLNSKILSIRKDVTNNLQTLLTEYVNAAEDYLKVLKNLEPDCANIDVAIEEVKKLTKKETDGILKKLRTLRDPGEFKNLKNFVHTEDLLLFLQSKKRWKISPQIFSLKDMCNVCRKKFKRERIEEIVVNGAHSSPQGIVFFSKLRSKGDASSDMTTVDCEYNGSGGVFSTEDGHVPIERLCQIRFPNPPTLEDNKNIKVEIGEDYFLRNVSLVDKTDTRSETPVLEESVMHESAEESPRTGS